MILEKGVLSKNTLYRGGRKKLPDAEIAIPAVSPRNPQDLRNDDRGEFDPSSASTDYSASSLHLGQDVRQCLFIEDVATSISLTSTLSAVCRPQGTLNGWNQLSVSFARFRCLEL